MFFKTINQIVIFVLFILPFRRNNSLFEIENMKHSFNVLRQLNLQSTNFSWSKQIQVKISRWEKLLEEDPLYFEDPVTNFLFLKFLTIDLKEEMIPERLKTFFRSAVNIPTRKDLKKSAFLLHEMMSGYNIPIQQEIVIMKLQWTLD